jgi:hydroxycarboxylate dehydrogenase B
MATVSLSDLNRITQELIEAVGTSPENAAIVTRVLVGAHLTGHDSHGLQHLPRYLEETEKGEIVADADPTVIEETASTARVRGNWGWGHVTADFVAELAVKKALDTGVALVSAVECNHIGRLGDYVEQAAAKDCIGLFMSGGNAEELATAAPFGGARAVLSPNPVAIAFPSDPDQPVVLDIATTIAAGGKIALAKAKGQDIPSGWIIDNAGRPSTKPQDYYDGGAILPFGEHKGFGFMVAAEIWGRILSGADEFSETPHGGTHFRHCGISFLAVSAGLFSDNGSFRSRTSELAKRVRAVPPQDGFDRVRMPGDVEHDTRVARDAAGSIEIPDDTWSQIVQAGERFARAPIPGLG